MGYAFIDPRGLRDRKAKLGMAIDELQSIRDQATGVLSASAAGSEVQVLAPVDTAVTFARVWLQRLNGYLADAELGSDWGYRARLLSRFSGGLALGSNPRQMLYAAAVLRVVEAMRTGQSPEEAGLAESLFPLDYLASLDEAARLRESAADLAVEMYMHGRTSGLDAELHQLLDRAAAAAPTVDYDDIRQFIYATDSLGSDETRHAVFARVFISDLEDIYGSPFFDPAAEPLRGAAEALAEGPPEFGVAFFEQFGPDRTALIPMHARYAEDPVVLELMSRALAKSSHLLPAAFGADVVRAYQEYWTKPLDPNPYEEWWGPNVTPLLHTMVTYEPPAYLLFEHGTFDYDFITAAYDQTERQYDDFSFVAYSPEGDWYPDPRSLLLQQVVDHREFDPLPFLTEERVGWLISADYHDGGSAAKSAFALLGNADPLDLEVRARIGDIVRQIGAAGGTLQTATAAGAAAMVHQHLFMFIPNAFYDEATERIHRPVTPQWGRFDVARGGYGNDGPRYDDTELVRFLEVVMRSEAAQMVLVDSLAGAVDVAIRQNAADPGRVSDELAWLTGRFLDVSSGLALQKGEKQDQINDLTRRILSHTIGLGVTAATTAAAPGLGLLAKSVLTVSRSELATWSLKRLLPSDNAQRAGDDWRHLIVDPVFRRDFRTKVLSVMLFESPELFDVNKLPPEFLVDGRLPPKGHDHGFCPTPELWDSWWDTQPFVTREIADSVDRLEAAFVGERALMSAPSINGPDLPFTRP